jgi:hypothetical protein
MAKCAVPIQAPFDLAGKIIKKEFLNLNSNYTKSLCY